MATSYIKPTFVTLITIKQIKLGVSVQAYSMYPIEKWMHYLPNLPKSKNGYVALPYSSSNKETHLFYGMAVSRNS